LQSINERFSGKFKWRRKERSEIVNAEIEVRENYWKLNAVLYSMQTKPKPKPMHGF